jgi:putative membrane protein
MKFISKTLASAAAIMFLAYLLPGIHAGEDFFYAILIALMLSVLNTLVRPVLVFLTLPATLVSMGLFLLVINAAIVLIADKFMDGFTTDSFAWALVFSILLSIINSVVNKAFINPKPKNKLIDNGESKVIIIEKD